MAADEGEVLAAEIRLGAQAAPVGISAAALREAVVRLSGFPEPEGLHTRLTPTHRLSLRVAHLLGKTVEDRRDLLDRVNHLYGVRSAIVHNGDYQVTEGELGLMRVISAAALVRVCTDEEFRRMSKGKDLARWFQKKLLEVEKDSGETPS